MKSERFKEKKENGEKTPNHIPMTLFQPLVSPASVRTGRSCPPTLTGACPHLIA